MKDRIVEIIESDLFGNAVDDLFYENENEIIDNIKEDSDWSLVGEIYGYEELENEYIYNVLADEYGHDKFYDEMFDEACDIVDDMVTQVYDKHFKAEFGYYIKSIGFPKYQTVWKVKGEHGKFFKDWNDHENDISVDSLELVRCEQIMEEYDGWWEDLESEYLEGTYVGGIFGNLTDAQIEDIKSGEYQYEFTNGCWEDTLDDVESDEEALKWFEDNYEII